MRHGFGARLWIGCAAGLLTHALAAQEALATAALAVRAGPDPDYPPVMQLAPGTSVRVHGCLGDWTWCDVGTDPGRGWVYASALAVTQGGRRWPLSERGAALGVAVVAFSFDEYWDRHYRDRSWYEARVRWAQRANAPGQVSGTRANDGVDAGVRAGNSVAATAPARPGAETGQVAGESAPGAPGTAASAARGGHATREGREGRDAPREREARGNVP